MADQPVGVGLVGFGTVGTGVVRVLREHGADIDARLGFPLVLKRIADIDLETDRGVPLDGIELGSDWREVVEDPEIDVLVELIGGTSVAKSLVLAALRAGKRVVTANKALLAHHGDEVYATAADHGTDIAFEAAVAGTIPVLRALREGLCADRVESLMGIVNGTCNYVLCEMEEQHEPYPSCVKRAQDLGFAEADPTFDVSGMDSTHKLAILAGLGLGANVHPDDISTEGIEGITNLDIEFARQFGLRIKLLAIAKRHEVGVEVRVHPTMIPAASVLARVGGPMNAVQVHGNMSGSTLYYGAGAGSVPTASAVVADVMELARSRHLGVSGRVPPLGTPTLREVPVVRMQDLEGEYYLRFSVLDRPGVLSAIAGALGSRGISIASVVQPDRHESRAVPVVIMTHRAREAALRVALEEIDQLDAVQDETRVIRIEREI